jgi:8-oxo-dGTP pyrophosphatase MutT (NUDIX family)
MAATPQDAATLVLMRDPIGAGSAPEVLLVKRCPEAAGVPGTYTFPGGQLTATDTIPSALALSRTFTAAEAALRLPEVQPDARALSLWIAALRTTFEQTGLLLARYGDGRLWEPQGPDVQRLLQHRRAILQGSTNFPNMMHDLERALATDLLLYFAHAITPETQVLPLSRRFFLAYMPFGVSDLPDQHAVGASLWVSPAEALQRQGNGDVAMESVTRQILHLLRSFPSAAAAVEHFRRQPVELVGQ